MAFTHQVKIFVAIARLFAEAKAKALEAGTWSEDQAAHATAEIEKNYIQQVVA